MSTEQATLTEPDQKQKAGQNSQRNLHLRLAERPVRNRVQHMVELATSLLQEAEQLAQDKFFADQARKTQTLDLSKGIDFYEEVTQFETGLIRMALEQTRGNQARAAELLNIKPTTLNSKIKLYKIEIHS